MAVLGSDPGSEVDGLPCEQRLLVHRDLEVWRFRADQAPGLLREVGRIREETFRAAGEGTGNALDLDDYDRWYEQLVVWDKARGLLVGGYRLGDASAIVQEHGVAGLYSHSLWDFDAGALARLGPALELGRSFIRVETQRAPVALSLLWRGIGAWLSLRPQVRRLFGPVSLDRGYTPHSLQAIVGHFAACRPSTTGMVAVARTPMAADAAARLQGARAADMAALDRLVAEQEPDGRGLPILVRHYAKMGARFVAANEDPAFSHVTDLLIEVDLDRTEPRRIRRFMGRAADAYLAWPSVTSPRR